MAKRNIFIGIIAALLVAPFYGIGGSRAEAQGGVELEELLANPGFEHITSGSPTGWTATGSGTITVSEDVYVLEGGRSVRLQDPNASVSVGLRSEAVPARSGYLYWAEVSAYTLQGSAQLYLEFWNDVGQRIGVSYKNAVSSGEWNRIEVEQIAPAGTVTATILLYQGLQNVGTAYFDGASLVNASAAGLLNGDFEQVASGKPVNWTAGTGNVWQSVTDIVYSGGTSVKLTDSSASKTTALRSSPVPVTEYEAYRAEVQSYNQSGSSSLYLEFWNEQQQRIHVQVVTNSTQGEWQYLWLEGLAPKGAIYATVLLYQGSANIGVAYFDDARLAVAPPEPLKSFPLLTPGHPRLYVTDNGIPALRAKANSEAETPFGVTGKQLWNALLEKAEGYLQETSITISYYGGHLVTYPFPPEQPPEMENPPGHTVTRYPYWTAYASNLLQRLQLLSSAYVITEREEFAYKALSYMRSISEWDSWTDPTYACDGGSCLDTADLVTGMATGYDMLYDFMSSADRTLIEGALEQKGLVPLYRDAYRKYDHNIQMKRVAALGTGAAALLGTSPEAERYLTRASNYFQWYLDAKVNSDQQEGLMYSSVGSDNMMMTLDHIARVSGVTDLIVHPFVNDFAIRWATHFMGPGGTGTANFSDSTYYPYFSEVALIQNQWMNNGMAGWYLKESRTAIDSLKGFLYLNPNATVTRPDDRDASTVLDEIGWAALRSGWGREDTLLAFISNNSTTGHNQFDQNSFQIGVNRSWIAADPGYREYNPGPRNDYSVRLGHSTIQVDGQGQTRLGGGSMTRGLLADGYDYIKGSAADAYSGLGLERFDRRIVFVKPEYYVMLDELKANAPRTFDWILNNGHIKRQAVDGVAAPAGQTVTGSNLYVRDGAAMLRAKFLGESDLPITVGAYPGAETYGLYTRVSSGTPSQSYSFLTVLKAEPYLRPGVYQETDLLPLVASSGSEHRTIQIGSDNLLFYRATEVGDYATMSFKVDEDGWYAIGSRFYQSPSYGQVKTYVNGTVLGSVYDNYNATVQPGPVAEHGQVYLTEGTHTIRYEVVGKNSLSANYFIGLDELRVFPVGYVEPTESFDALPVQRIAGTGALGARLELTDSPGMISRVLFREAEVAPGTSYTVDGVSSDAEQSVVTSVYEHGRPLARPSSLLGRHRVRGDDGQTGRSVVRAYAATRGTGLSYMGKVLLGHSPVSGVAADYDLLTERWRATVELDASTKVLLYLPGSRLVRINGVPADSQSYSYEASTGLLTIKLDAGRHELTAQAQPNGFE